MATKKVACCPSMPSSGSRSSVEAELAHPRQVARYGERALQRDRVARGLRAMGYGAASGTVLEERTLGLFEEFLD